jgi:hypothetical protein
MTIEQVRFRGRTLRPHKAIHDAQFEMRTVLTTDPFNYVDLWLRRRHQEDALFYWRQARAFHRAAQGLPIESSPLVLYYCFMNAAKALLAAKGVQFDPRHGVSSNPMRGPNSKVVLSNEGIKFHTKGIAPALSTYLKETEPSPIHSLEDILYNLLCIHRTYCLTYKNRREVFLPLRDVEYVRDTNTGNVTCRARVVNDIDWKTFKGRLPNGFAQSGNDTQTISSTAPIQWATTDRPTDVELDGLRGLNELLRSRLQYIKGSQTLWYLKTDSKHQILRQPLTLALAAMHRLSEICRYRPSELDSFINGQKNWLLSEFVLMTPDQYLDEIACEITGHQVMIPNVRAPA